MRHVLVLLGWMLVCSGLQAEALFSQSHVLPSGGVVVVAEGRDEQADNGSYSVRLFAEQSAAGWAGFRNGVILQRPGRVEGLHWLDMDGNGSTDLVVSLRAADGGLTADVFRFDEQRVTWVKHSGRLPADADPVQALAGKVMAPEKPAAVGTGSGPLQLHKRRSRGTTVVPDDQTAVEAP